MTTTLTTADERRFEVGLRNTGTGQKAFDLLFDPGSIPVAVLNVATNPTAADTIGIGDDTYEFRGSGADLSDDAFIAVEIAGSAADTRDNLVDAINAVDADNAHPTIFQTDSTTPALANGTENVLATETGTTVVVQGANAPGGDAAAGSPSIVLAESLTNASDTWDVGNVNLNTLAGVAKSSRQTVTTELVITSAMITAGTIRIDLAFQPTHYTWQARQDTGEIRHSVNDIVVPASNGFSVTLNGGGSPDVQNTDVLTVVAYE